MHGFTNVNVLSLFFGSFSASFLYSLLDIPLEFLFLFGITESKLYAGQQNGRFIFLDGRKIFFPHKIQIALWRTLPYIEQLPTFIC